MSRRPLVVARWSTIAAVTASTALAAWLVPEIAPLESAAGLWRTGLLWAAGAFMLGAVIWADREMRERPGRPVDDLTRRRLAHDFPFKLARVIFVGAVVAGAGTSSLLWERFASGGAAIVTGAITYLLVLLPAMPVYLIARRTLRAHAAGQPGAPPLRALRQSVALRLVFAVQLPVVVCAVGIVLVEQSDAARYTQELEIFYRARYATLTNRTLGMLTPEDRAATLATLRLRAGVHWQGDEAIVVAGDEPARATELRLPPFILLALVLLLSARLGRWLALEVTSELRRVGDALNTLTAAPDATHDAPIVAAVALRETGDLLAALNAALNGFRERRLAMAAAADQRRRAEQAKSRFLAHLSHELKSPLNNILGFCEVLLCGIDGPLAEAQRERLAIVWRSGDSLLRFILVLLDLASMETGARADDGRAAATGHRVDPRPVDVDALLQALEQNARIDPTGDLVLTLRPGARAAVEVDVAWLSRSILSLAGLLQDCMEVGEVEIALTGDEALTIHVAVVSGTAAVDGEDRARLSEEITLISGALRAGATLAELVAEPRLRQRVLVTLTLADWVVTANGGALHSASGTWPSFTLTFPAIDAEPGGA